MLDAQEVNLPKLALPIVSVTVVWAFERCSDRDPVRLLIVIGRFRPERFSPWLGIRSRGGRCPGTGRFVGTINVFLS